MKFSLILPTIETDQQELQRFLDSLIMQTYSNWELIIIDQNSDNRIEYFTQSYINKTTIIHLKSAPGLSRARNVGLRAANGDVFCFPDDDCWYPTDLLARVLNFFQSHPEWAGVSGRCLDQAGKPTFGKWDKRSGVITKFNVWNRAISITIFLKRVLIESVGEFEETLGLGSCTSVKSGEEMDYLMRVLEKGFYLEYLPWIEVFHTQEVMKGFETNQKVYTYSIGGGWVMRKHQLPHWFIIIKVLRICGGILKACFLGNFVRARYIYSILIGMIRGYFLAGR